MVPSPLFPYHVQLILRYIVPPSELTDPIPKHLLSRSLIQRHVFLELQPSDSASYLCWDAESRDRTVSLLESLHNPFDDLVSPLPVAYLVDDESAFAHVHVRSLGAEDLRIVFEWEESDSSWKYHDAGLMPFPPATHPTLDATLSSMVTADRKAVPDDVDSARSLEEGDEDSYWNAYGGADDDDQTSPDLRVTDAEKGGSDDEDAYWAQYSSVQGTADSTIPTPPHRSARRLVPAPEEPLPIPAATMIRPRSGPRDPPSPTTLASRLGHLEPGPWSIRPVSAPRSPPDYNFDDMVSQHAETEGDSQDGESASRSLLSTSELAPYSSRSSDVGGVDSDGSEPPKPVNLLSQQPASVGQIVGEDKSLKQAGGPEDDGVREVIRGAYRLWKAVHAGVGTQQDFAHLVLNAIEGI